MAPIVYILTCLAVLDVVLTRARLANEKNGAGTFRIGRGLVKAHTVAGVLAHVGLVLGVCIFTSAYLTSAV